jgi:hypothetical protein
MATRRLARREGKTPWTELVLHVCLDYGHGLLASGTVLPSCHSFLREPGVTREISQAGAKKRMKEGEPHEHTLAKSNSIQDDV